MQGPAMLCRDLLPRVARSVIGLDSHLEAKHLVIALMALRLVEQRTEGARGEGVTSETKATRVCHAWSSQALPGS